MLQGKNILFWIAIILVFMALYNMSNDPMQQGSVKDVPFSTFLDEVDAGRVDSVNITGNTIKGKFADGSNFKTLSANYPNLIEDLRKQGVAIDIKATDTTMGTLLGIFLSWLPFLIIIGVWFYVMRQMQGGGRGGGGAMGFGKSRARLMLAGKGKKVTFDDVAGVEEAKDDLHEIVEFLKDPEKFQKLGGKIPKGCLLVGSPGTGKTLLARAIAGEAGVPFFTISGSDFVEMFVGVGASRVRDLFEQGKKQAPCLIFIDEIDAVGRHRGAGVGGGNDEREQTLNQLLVEMDGFEGTEGVIIIAATNRPDVLDPALLRPGRFDRQIVVPSPDVGGREKILVVHMGKVPLGPDVDPKIIARGTPGFTGADLANLVNEAALLAARRNKKVVTMSDFEYAKDKVMMGAERRSMVIGEEEKRLTAYHEAGHAIVSLHCPESDPIHKATIIPRGRALGLVMRLPEKDRLSLTRGKAEADIAVAMGGRVAEELIFGHQKVTSGASSDIKMATRLARAMVTEWGMSEKIGPLFHSSDQEEVFLGHSMTQQKNMSNDTANLIDNEVKSLVEEGYNLAQDILKKYNNQLEILAQALLEYETLAGDEIKDLIDGKPIRQYPAAKGKNAKTSAPRLTSVPTTDKPDEEDAPKADKPKKPKKPKTKKDDGDTPAPEGAS